MEERDQVTEEIMQLYGEILRIDAEILSIKDAQIKPRQQVKAELQQRMRDAYLEKEQMRLPLDHGSDIVEGACV